ncbi:MAG: phosphoenolpyruvate-protein phosphotransferase [Thiogranum sp.]
MADSSGICIRGTPYAPGHVSGIVRRGLHLIKPDSLLILSHAEIATLVEMVHGAGSERAQHFDRIGVIVIDGAPLSHVMIRLLGLGIPTVMLPAARLEVLKEGAALALDGGTGLIGDPLRVAGPPQGAGPSVPAPGAGISTRDGVAVRLSASVAGRQGAAQALECGAASVGLVRSEYLLPAAGEVASADYFEAVFTELCEAARPLAVTVRLADIAAGKPGRYLTRDQATLGPRGSQLYAAGPVRRIFEVQVEALGRLGGRYDVSILLPNLFSAGSCRRWRDEINDRLNGALRIGAMAETPAAALAIDELADCADFTALGCNDLMQCFFGVDRDVAELSPWLDPCAPALWRLLREAAARAGAHLDEVQLCGLLPQAPGVLPLLVGSGFRAFSVEPRMIPALAETVRGLDTESAAALVAAVCEASGAAQVRDMLGLRGESAWALARVDSRLQCSDEEQ